MITRSLSSLVMLLRHRQKACDASCLRASCTQPIQTVPDESCANVARRVACSYPLYTGAVVDNSLDAAGPSPLGPVRPEKSVGRRALLRQRVPWQAPAQPA